MIGGIKLGGKDSKELLGRSLPGAVGHILHFSETPGRRNAGAVH